MAGNLCGGREEEEGTRVLRAVVDALFITERSFGGPSGGLEMFFLVQERAAWPPRARVLEPYEVEGMCCTYAVFQACAQGGSTGVHGAFCKHGQV